MRSADKILAQRAVELVKDLIVLGLKNFLPLGKNVTEHQQLHSLCLVGNRFENGIERAPGELEKLSEL